MPSNRSTLTPEQRAALLETMVPDSPAPAGDARERALREVRTRLVGMHGHILDVIRDATSQEWSPQWAERQVDGIIGLFERAMSPAPAAGEGEEVDGGTLPELPEAASLAVGEIAQAAARAAFTANLTTIDGEDHLYVALFTAIHREITTGRHAIPTLEHARPSPAAELGVISSEIDRLSAPAPVEQGGTEGDDVLDPALDPTRCIHARRDDEFGTVEVEVEPGDEGAVTLTTDEAARFGRRLLALAAPVGHEPDDRAPAPGEAEERASLVERIVDALNDEAIVARTDLGKARDNEFVPLERVAEIALRAIAPASPTGEAGDRFRRVVNDLRERAAHYAALSVNAEHPADARGRFAANASEYREAADALAAWPGVAREGERVLLWRYRSSIGPDAYAARRWAEVKPGALGLVDHIETRWATLDPAPVSSAAPECGSVSKAGLRCARPSGHGGSHNVENANGGLTWWIDDPAPAPSEED